jgi:hypothetical protein
MLIPTEKRALATAVSSLRMIGIVFLVNNAPYYAVVLDRF